jgi:hypothetical protein
VRVIRVLGGIRCTGASRVTQNMVAEDLSRIAIVSRTSTTVVCRSELAHSTKERDPGHPRPRPAVGRPIPSSRSNSQPRNRATNRSADDDPEASDHAKVHLVVGDEAAEHPGALVAQHHRPLVLQILVHHRPSDGATDEASKRDGTQRQMSLPTQTQPTGLVCFHRPRVAQGRHQRQSSLEQATGRSGRLVGRPVLHGRLAH